MFRINRSLIEVYMPPGFGHTVLVVDDEPTVRTLVATILAAGGYDVLTSSNGPDALRMAAEKRIDLLLTDMMMPGMDGVELITRARAEAGASIGRFMVMSGYVSDLRHAPELAGVPLVSKPFTSRDLLDRIQGVLGYSDGPGRVREP